MSKPVFHLVIPRQDFVEALSLLKNTVARRNGEEAILSHDGNGLQIRIGGGGTTVPAPGNWEAQLRVGGVFLPDLADVVPLRDPLPLRVEGDFLLIDALKLPCVVQDPPLRMVELPVNADLGKFIELLSLERWEDVVASGLGRILPKELLDAPDFLQRLVGAWKQLEPEGVQIEDLFDLVLRKKGLERETYFS